MNKSLLVTAALLTASLAQAGQVLVGTAPGNGGFFVGNQANLYNSEETGPGLSYANLTWAQGFSLTEAVIVSDLRVFVNQNNVPSTFNARISDSIGPGTTGANLLFTGSGTFPTPGDWVNVSVGGLALNPGNYYLTLSSDTAVPVPLLDGSDCLPDGLPAPGGQNLCFATGGWGTGGTQTTTYGNVGDLRLTITGFAFNSPGAALTDFNTQGEPNGGSAAFEVIGDLATPEPSTFALFAPAGLGLLMLARRRRKV